MKNLMKQWYLIILVSFLFITGCDCRRPLVEDVGVWTRVTVDWSNSGIGQPNGTSVWFFPEDGLRGAQVLRMQTKTDSLMLYKGNYSVLVFNETESDHDYILFRNTGAYQSFEAYAKDINVDNRYMVRSGSEKMAATPDELAVATMTDLVITREMIRNDERPWLSFEPKRTFSRVNVTVHINGLDNVSSSGGSAGSLSGMADGVVLSSGLTSSNQITHMFNLNNIRFNEGSYQQGTMSASFMVFGLTDMATRPAEGVTNYLTLFFRLRNGKDWEQNVEIDVTKRISEIVDQSGFHTLNIVVGDGEYEVINIPDVPDANEPGSGFDATVTDWGDEVVTEIPM